MSKRIVQKAAKELGGTAIQYDGNWVVSLGYDNAIDVAATATAPSGYFYEPINSMLIGVWPI